MLHGSDGNLLEGVMQMHVKWPEREMKQYIAIVIWRPNNLSIFHFLEATNSC